MSNLPAPPGAPGSLTKPPATAELRDYLTALDSWHTQLGAQLDALDKKAQSSRTPDVYSGDVSLAMALRASIDARTQDLMKTWDSGRVGPDQLAAAAALIWGRLPDSLGNPSAFSLVEACTLVVALFARLDAQLSADVLVGSGATDAISLLRATLDRCSLSAKTLHRRQDDVDGLSARLDALLGTGNQADIAPGVAGLSKEAFALEALLVKEIGLRAAVTRDAAAAAATRVRLLADEASVRDLAAQADQKIVGTLRLAIPSVATVGASPLVPTAEIDEQPGTWTAARAELDAYLARLSQVDAALKEARTRYGAGLAKRGDLRGLLGAYRDKAEQGGFAEDPTLSAQFLAAKTVLWGAPCDLSVAEQLVGTYQQSVLARTTPASLRTASSAVPSNVKNHEKNEE